jgi:hypothetical protein
MIDWSYVAGFFDGEGNVGKIREGTIQLRFCNIDKPVLEDIQEFIGCGQVYLIAKTGKKHRHDYFQLIISRHSDVLRVAEELVNRCRIKRMGLLRAIEYIRGKSINEGWYIGGRDSKGRFLKEPAKDMGVEVKTD